MYERYIEEYKKHSIQYGQQTAIFLQVGSFYELYDIPDPITGHTNTSMKTAVDILGIALRVKKGDAPGGHDGFFAGFPDSQLHKFAALLTREGWTVVVIDQVKDTAGRVEKRCVARILSPGTHVEAATSGSDAVYLGGLWMEPAAWLDSTTGAVAPSFAAAVFDLSTGATRLYEGRATGRREAWTADDLLHFFAVHPPREMILWWCGAGLDLPSEQTLRRNLGLGPSTLLHIRTVTTKSNLENGLVREELLRRCFNPRSLLPLRQVLGLVDKPLCEKALCSLLLFVEDHFPAALHHLSTPLAWTPREAVALGNHALTQLNMITPREEDSVLGLFRKTVTPLGPRGLRQRLLYPLCDSGKLEKYYEEVQWWMDLDPALEEDYLRALRGIGDLSRLHRKITTASVQPMDILSLDQSYTCSTKLRDAFAATGSPLDLEKQGHSFKELDAYRAAFAAVFDVEKAKDASEDLFCLTAEAGPGVAALEKEIAEAQAKVRSIHKSLAQWLQESEDSLHLEFKESVLQISAAKGLIGRAQTKLKSCNTEGELQGLQIHSKKAGGGTIEIPSLTRLFHKILGLRDRLSAEVRKELSLACDRLGDSYSSTWSSLEEWITRIDVTAALARVAKERGFCRPCLVESEGCPGAFLRATSLRHPLIEAQQTRLEYKSHDITLGSGDSEGWLLYGMNASGKSSLMKSVGLAVLLAQAGSFVPAASFHLSPFRSLFTRILNTDNLWAGLSSFAVEMTELREILQRADSYSLVLGDEVCSGTESISATALVGSTLEWFSQRRIRYMFATHLHDLQKLSTITGLRGLQTWHLRVRYDPVTDRLVYERSLHPGPGTTLYGLEVAKAMAIPLELLERAHKIRRDLLGSATEEDAPTSDWNATLQRRACELCGCGIVKDLEVHHIQPRAEAVDGFSGGVKLNDLRNLIVVCQVCHDKHHAGMLKIGPMQQTSDGPQRSVLDFSKYEHKIEEGRPATIKSHSRQGGLSENQIQKVESYLLRYPNCTPSRLVFDLEQKEGIKITQQRLRSMRANLPRRSSPPQE